MKKTHFLLIFIMTFSLFFVILDINSEKELSDTYNLFGLNDWEAVSDIQFDNNIKKMEDTDYINKLKELGKKHDVIIVSSNIKRTENGEENHMLYIYTDKDINKLFNLNTSKGKLEDKKNLEDKENVLHREEALYSTDNNLNPDYQIHFINNKLSVRIYPLTYLKEDSLQKYRPLAAYSKSQDNIEKFNFDIAEEFSFASPKINKMQNDTFDYDLAFRRQVFIFFILGTILLTLFMIYNVSDNMNKIAIKKMHGFSNIRIALGLFWSIILYVVITEILTTVIAFLLYINKFNETVMDFLKQYFQALLTINMVFIAILIVVYLIISIIKLPKLIKNYNFNNILLNVTFFAKIIFIILLLPMLIEGLTGLYISLPKYIELKKAEDNYNGIYLIDSDTEDTRFDGYYIEKYSQGETDEVYDKHVRIYDSLLDSSHLVFQSQNSTIAVGSYISGGISVSQVDYSGFTVDKAYIKRHPILVKDGKEINLDLSRDTVYILLPESIAKKSNLSEDNFYAGENPTELLIISDKQKIMNYSLATFGPLEMSKYQKSPIIVVYSDNSFRYNKSILIDSYLVDFKDIKEANKELEKVDSEKIYNLKSSEERIEQSKNNQIFNIMNSLISLIPVTIVIVAMNISILGLYYRSKKKKLAVLKINGYSSLRANLDLIIELFISFIIPAVVLYTLYAEEIVLASIYVLLIEIICIVIVLIHYRRMNVIFQVEK